MKMLIATLLLASTLALADYEDDYRRIDQYETQEHAWVIEVRERDKEYADDTADRYRDLYSGTGMGSQLR